MLQNDVKIGKLQEQQFKFSAQTQPKKAYADDCDDYFASITKKADSSQEIKDVDLILDCLNELTL